MLIGYARCSTSDQDTSLQIAALKAAGCTSIYQEFISGAKMDRPQLTAAIKAMGQNDCLVVWKLDRLGRNTVGVITLVQELAAKGIGFKSLTESLSTDTAMGKMMLTVMAGFAEMERSLISERTKAGMKVAALNGRHCGRPRKQIVSAS